MDNIAEFIPSEKGAGLEFDAKSGPGSDNAGDFQTGLDRALDKFMDVPKADNPNTISLKPLQEPDSPMSLLRDSVANYIEQDKKLSTMADELGKDKPVAETRETTAAEDLQTTAQQMLAIQMQYQYKSMNGALLLATAKSAEGFVKTLMRSQ